MRVSFLVLARENGAHIARCLTHVARLAEPGDRVVAVDDGSQDGTGQAILRYAAEHGFADGVDFVPLLLGSRTPGDLGICANIALDHAAGDAVIFVPGQGWPDGPGFRASREAMEQSGAELWVGGVVEWAQGSPCPGFDPPGAGGDGIAGAVARVPSLWRLLIRRSLIGRLEAALPEGEPCSEVPFHWTLALHAERIGAGDRPVVHREIDLARPFDGGALARRYAELGRRLGPLRRRRRQLAMRAFLWQLDREIDRRPLLSTESTIRDAGRVVRGLPSWMRPEAPPGLAAFVKALGRRDRGAARGALHDRESMRAAGRAALLDHGRTARE